ncbi:hypothetical protein GF339_01395 [candidate division KSB3 bacterium]|uniref:Uncharacterized protein n=1 Tax=candidate division KSB3 bacterium TaxID=2044937 RepID=A0A9D5Q403_9BACT|nr:hypothetical protein [candidate division KSB3 bacterium]MBD3323204.1 hypothetical protein [candidate division KSB3 bacterium]
MGVRVPPSASPSSPRTRGFRVFLFPASPLAYRVICTMKIKPTLGGGKSGDPSLYIDIIDRKRVILFDCGLNNFRHANLRKVSDLFISHTHIDHFIGFDTLLRLNLAETKTLHIYGPPGIHTNVAGKLQGYTWNICQNLRLTIVVHEIFREKMLLTQMESSSGFSITQVVESHRLDPLLDTGEFSVRHLWLDHKTPSLGYCFREADTFNVHKETMYSLGLTPGPWVARLKAQAFHPEADHILLDVGDTQRYPLNDLARQLLIRKKGVKITYLTDFIFDAASLDDITQFAWESDLLFCEAAFLEKDRQKAKRAYHLTAKEAGILARTAHVKHLVLFHFSKRYQDYAPLLEEARQEFSSVE